MKRRFLYFSLFLLIFGHKVLAANLPLNNLTSTTSLQFELDTDKDGLTDKQELYYKTNPKKVDTDNDTFTDAEELKHNFSPLYGQSKRLLDVDTDKDGLNDAWEIALSTDLSSPDTDGDGFKDGQEVFAGFDPRDKSSKKCVKEIKVDITRQVLAYYFNGRKLEEFLVSTGVNGMNTPRGDFKILAKIPSKTYGGTGYNFYYPNTKWNLHFYTGKLGFYIHGAYWHNNFGVKMSHGCVNVSYANMERLYNWTDVGTKLTIY